MRDSRSHEATQQGMGGTGWNAEPPGEQVPGDGADQAGKYDFQRYEMLVDRIGNRIPDFKFSNQVFGYKKMPRS